MSAASIKLPVSARTTNSFKFLISICLTCAGIYSVLEKIIYQIELLVKNMQYTIESEPNAALKRKTTEIVIQTEYTLEYVSKMK